MSVSAAMEALIADMEKQTGSFAISVDEAGDWATAYVFGKEAEDSPMAGGASYGSGSTAEEALQMIVDECQLNRG